MRDERIPGTTRYRRSTCGCGAYGQSAELHAFQPKWCNSSPNSGILTSPTRWPYVRELGSTSITSSASLSLLPGGLRAATNACFSGGACIASLGDGENVGSG